MTSQLTRQRRATREIDLRLTHVDARLLTAARKREASRVVHVYLLNKPVSSRSVVLLTRGVLVYVRFSALGRRDCETMERGERERSGENGNRIAKYPRRRSIREDGY